MPVSRRPAARLPLLLALAALPAGASRQDASRPKAPLTAGSPAPSFEAQAHDGTTVKLAAMRGNPVVLYVFPKADTPG